MQVEHASGRHRLTSAMIFRIARQPKKIRDAVNRSRMQQGLEVVPWPEVPAQLPEARDRGSAAIARIRAVLAATR